jgi:hypothetical protein
VRSHVVDDGRGLKHESQELSWILAGQVYGHRRVPFGEKSRFSRWVGSRKWRYFPEN